MEFRWLVLKPDAHLASKLGRGFFENLAWSRAHTPTFQQRVCKYAIAIEFPILMVNNVVYPHV